MVLDYDGAADSRRSPGNAIIGIQPFDLTNALVKVRANPMLAAIGPRPRQRFINTRAATGPVSKLKRHTSTDRILINEPTLKRQGRPGLVRYIFSCPWRPQRRRH